MKVLTFARFLRERFGFPVKKLPVHLFLGCPHRENRIGKGGCYYCSNSSFSQLTDYYGLSVENQIKKGIDTYRRKGFEGGFIAYFQTYTNTYCDTEEIRKAVEQALGFEDVVGISVSTRPDCLPDDMLDFFDGIGSKRMFWLEIGLQSAHNKTLEIINRGHNFACFEDALLRAGRRENLFLCTHLILGLPGEDRGDMAESIRIVKKLGSHGIKLHHLQIIRGTEFEKWYRKGQISVLDWQEYLELLLYLAPIIGEDLIVHRWVAEAQEELLIAPKWDITKQEFLKYFYERLKSI